METGRHGRSHGFQNGDEVSTNRPSPVRELAYIVRLKGATLLFRDIRKAGLGHGWQLSPAPRPVLDV